MQSRFSIMVTMCIIGFVVTACGSNTAAPVLPTATLPPSVLEPTLTPTTLPPPTVTPFPTGDVLVSDSIPPPAEPTGDSQSTSLPTIALTVPADQPTATEFPTPTASGSSPGFPPGVTVGQKIFSADFYQGWPTTDDATARIRIIGGRYVFEIGPFDARYITTASVNHSNTYTQVEASPDSCTGGVNEGYGLIFRYVDSSNYYLVTFFCDNSFSVTARINGSIVSGAYADGPLPSGLNTSAPQAHFIGVHSKSDAHTIYFDGKEIAAFDAASLEKGDVGLYAVSSGTGVVVVGFDNLQVWSVP